MKEFFKLFLLLNFAVSVFTKLISPADATFSNGEKSRGDKQANNATSSSIDNICLTQSCVEIAAFIIKNIDESKNPCDDFYTFACGKYMKRTVIPDEKGAISVFSSVGDSLEERMRLILEEESIPNESKTAKMTKNLYKSCLNATLASELGLKPLNDILATMGGWPVVAEETWNETNFSMIEAMYKNHKLGFRTDTLFSFEVDVDQGNSSRRVIQFDQTDLGLRREYLIKGIDDADVKAYLKYAIEAAVLLGARRDTAEVEMLNVVLFEMELANISSPREERRNKTRLYNVRSIQDLQDMIPQVPWLNYINMLLPHSVQITTDKKIVVEELNFYRYFSRIINNVNKRTLANYILWRVVMEAATYLSEDIRQLEFELEKKLEGKTSRNPRWKECVLKIQDKLPFGIGYLYVKNYFNEESKVEMETLVKYLHNSFDEILNTVDWMDNITRHKAMEKLNLMRPQIAYPKELVIDSIIEEYFKNLTIDEYSYIANILRLNIFQTDTDRGVLHEAVDKNDWRKQANVAQVNAYYYWNENTIKLPAGILQGIFFEQSYPQYVKFSGIGLVVGHEITHGFDDQGRQFDAEGNLFNWWQPETEAKYLEKAKCIVEQYSNYILPENGLKLNGINSQGEDIADNGGTKESYRAYRQWVKDNGPEPTLPGLSYSANQLFWISYAQKLCERSRPEYQKKQVLTGVHTPKKFRIVGPLRNSKEFANDFKCPLGSYMNPADKCEVW